jgi:pimeloyl-ACP methyl ester carboxylesterase
MAAEAHFVTLRDGRRLAYAEYGDPDGEPAFYFHGTPGGYCEGAMLHDAARAEGIRLIAVDRPGYGDSGFKRGRQIADWPDDVSDLAGALGIERFSVVGVSGGSPHCQACAARMPDRLNSATIISGAGSHEAILDGATGWRRLLRRGLLAFAPLFAWWVALWTALWAPLLRDWMVPRRIDRAVLARRDVRQAFVVETRHAMKQGPRAMAQDLTLFARPWGFTPADAGRARVILWHGDDDAVVPVSIGRYYAREIPGCTATFVAGGGHLMVIDRARDIFRAVRRAAP